MQRLHNRVPLHRQLVSARLISYHCCPNALSVSRGVKSKLQQIIRTELNKQLKALSAKVSVCLHP